MKKTEMTQFYKVLKHLNDHGYITDLVARNYGIRRLAARVHDINRAGYGPVVSEMRTDDAGSRYAYYTYAA